MKSFDINQTMAGAEQQMKNSLIYLLPTIVVTVLPFITIPIFTRILTVEDYGILALAQIYAVFASGLANFGMALAYDRNYFRYRGDRLQTAQLLYSTLLFVLSNFLLIAGLTYFFRGTLSKLVIGSAEHGDILVLSLCALFVTSISNYYLTFFRNSESAKDTVIYTISVSLANFVVALYLVAFLQIGVIGIVYAQLLSGTVGFCILSYRFMTSLSPSLNRGILADSLRIAYPLVPRVFLGVLGTQSDKYLVGLLASVGAAGIYSIGHRVSYMIFAFMTAIENVFSPQVYDRMFELSERGGEAIGKYITPFAYTAILMGLLVSLLAEEIISLLTPVSYHGAIDIVVILSLYYGFLFFGKLNGTQLIFAKKTHITSLLTIISTGIIIGLNVPFIMKWGVMGAAWATLLAGLISGIMFFAAAQYYYEIKWEYGRMGAIFLTFFGASVLAILLREAQVDYYIRVGFKLAAFLLYMYIGVKIGVITRQNLSRARNVLLSFSFQKMIDNTTVSR